jgi:hypothetical protein
MEDFDEATKVGDAQISEGREANKGRRLRRRKRGRREEEGAHRVVSMES